MIRMSATDQTERIRQLIQRNREHNEALGRITVEFSALEWFLTIYLLDLLEPNTRMSPEQISRLHAQKLISDFREAFEVREDDPIIRKKLYSILKHIDDLRKERNRFVHAVWNMTSLEIDLEGLDKREAARILVSVDELRELSDNIVNTLGVFHRFMQSWLSTVKQLSSTDR